MSNGKAAAAPKKKTGAAAAKAESNGHNEVEFRGLKLSVPSKLPGDVAFAYAELEESSQQSLAPVIGFVRSLIGADQIADVRAKLRDDEVTMDDIAGELETLVEAVLAVYNTDAGKSSASPKS